MPLKNSKLGQSYRNPLPGLILSNPYGSLTGNMNILYEKNCVAFWQLGHSLSAVNDPSLNLIPRGQSTKVVEDGMISVRSRLFEGNAWLEIPRNKLGPLNRFGENSSLSIVAWIRWEKPELYQAIGGIWNETERMRQYCMFLNITSRYDSFHNLHGHISHEGGPTPGFDYCITYATGITPIPLHEWVMLAITYDGRQIRAFVNGKIDTNSSPNPLRPGHPPLNPFPYSGRIFDGGPQGADFTLGGVHRSGEMGNWFHGLIDTFGVFDRALSENELILLHNWNQKVLP